MFLLLTAHATAPVGLCAATERPRFACTVKGGKMVALCEDKGVLLYRFGKPGNVELSLPMANTGPVEIARERLGEDEVRHVATAYNDDYRYALVSHRNEDQFDLSLSVRRGGFESVARFACGDTQAVDFTETDKFPVTPGRLQSWLGHWKGSVPLSIRADGSQLVVHTADQTFTGTLTKDGKLTVRDDSCSLDASLSATGELTVTGPCAPKGVFHRDP